MPQSASFLILRTNKIPVFILTERDIEALEVEGLAQDHAAT